MIAEFGTRRSIDASIRHDVDLIVEELFTNCVKYNREGQHDIEIGLAYQGDRVEISVVDYDVHEFDPTQAPPVDVTRPASGREPGGLGIHLVRKLAGSVSYEYVDGNSIITVTKQLEE